MTTHDLTGKGNPHRSTGRLCVAQEDYDTLAKTVKKAGYPDLLKIYKVEGRVGARGIEKITQALREAFTEALLKE